MRPILPFDPDRDLSNTRSPDASSGDKLVRLWILRALVNLNEIDRFVQQRDYADTGLASFLGLPGLDPDEGRKRGGRFDRGKAKERIRKLLRAAEKQPSLCKVPCMLAQNTESLADLLGLNHVECRILELAVLLQTHVRFNAFGDFIEDVTDLGLRRVLAVMLQLEDGDVKLALSRRAHLAVTGLVAAQEGTRISLLTKLDLLSEAFGEGMLTDAVEPIDILRGTISRCSPAHLCFDDYPHIQNELNLLQLYLKRVVPAGKPGVNVLIFGPPGTGKSQLARAIACELKLCLFEVSSEDTEGEPIDAPRRLRASRAAQAILARSRTMLLFDEVEDVFSDGNGLFSQKSTAQEHKAWVNRLLEENPVPTLWLTNNVTCIDPAFLRRFDIVMELPVPQLSQRRRLVMRVAGDLLPSASVERIATCPSVAPALMTRASEVVRSVQNDLSTEQVPKAIEWLISATLKAQGHAPLQKDTACRQSESYDPAFVNTTEDLTRIAEGLRQTKSARMCLYGPPGTGKTAYGRWLAAQLEVPLAVRRASDILSKWVGGTEENLATAFREAEADGAVLLIDEIDTFLRDRHGAHHSWEVSAVNEMLTQMEGFAGVFIASTNLVGGLDKAALRRFDIKLKFDYMRADQAWAMFQRHCADLGLLTPEEGLRARITRLSTLTPGDFAAMCRQHRFRPFSSAARALAALESECSWKDDQLRAPIGFIHPARTTTHEPR